MCCLSGNIAVVCLGCQGIQQVHVLVVREYSSCMFWLSENTAVLCIVCQGIQQVNVSVIRLYSSCMILVALEQQYCIYLAGNATELWHIFSDTFKLDKTFYSRSGDKNSLLFFNNQLKISSYPKF